MAKVVVIDGNLEKALKQFKRKVESEGTLKEFRKRMYYTPPGVLKREAKKEARRKQLKQMHKQRLIDKRFP